MKNDSISINYLRNKIVLDQKQQQDAAVSTIDIIMASKELSNNKKFSGLKNGLLEINSKVSQIERLQKEKIKKMLVRHKSVGGPSNLLRRDKTHDHIVKHTY